MRRTMWSLFLARASLTTVIKISIIIVIVETYERKGRLYKKSLNSDKFKER